MRDDAEPGQALPPSATGVRAWWPWCAAVLFLLWQVAFQFAYGFLAEPIQKEFSLTTSEAAAIASVYLLAYGLMQLPAGLLLDRFGVRWLLPGVALGAVLSVMLFAQAEDYLSMVVARILAGVFMAFVFPATGKIARMRLPAARFVLAMALADMCFGVGAVVASGLPGLFLEMPWRELMLRQSFMGLGLVVLLGLSVMWIRNPAPAACETSEDSSVVWHSLGRRTVLAGIGLYVWGGGLSFGFGGYWNLKLQESCGCTAPQVSALSIGLFAGLGAGMLLAGLLGGDAGWRRSILRSSTLLGFALLGLILWISATASMQVLMILMVGLGMVLGSSSLSFAVAVTGLPARHAATVVALVNAGGCLSGALLQELPVWLGGGRASLLTVSISYLGVAALGILCSWWLPGKRDTA